MNLEVPSNDSKSSSARRRHALREFYKLQAQAPGESSPSASPVDDELESVHPESDIDKEGITVEDYITKLVRHNDLQRILEAENGLVSEIRGLESEKKALIYNNYSKLILAANTLNTIQQDDNVSNEKIDQLHGSLKAVADLSTRILKSSKQSAQVDVNHAHLAKWLLSVPERTKRFQENGQIDKAQTEAKMALEMLDMMGLSSKSIETVTTACNEVLRL